MTATTAPLPRTAASPATIARIVLAVAVVANLVLIEVLFVGYGTGRTRC
jgi:hypothetical protein